MKRLAVLVVLTLLLVPGVALAGPATDAALGLGAFAVFNQILAGTGVFGAVAAPAPVVAAAPAAVYTAPPAPVYVTPPAPAYVAPPAPVYVAPPPPVYVAPPVVAYPTPPVYYGPRAVYASRPHWHRHHWDRRW